MSLILENISFSYNGKNILKDISFSLSEPCTMAILGHNGSGKTTLLKIMAGIYKNYSGKILIEGRDLKEMSFSEISKFVAYVPGEIFCPFDFNVENIIAMGLNPYKKWWQDFDKNDREEVNLLMEKLRIEYLKNRSINKISSGERQLVFLAQAIIQKPKLLLLDEPTSHLDLNFKIKTMEIINEMGKEIFVILVSHDIKSIFSYCQFCLALKDGKNLFFGAVSELKENLIIEAYNIENRDKFSNFI